MENRIRPCTAHRRPAYMDADRRSDTACRDCRHVSPAIVHLHATHVHLRDATKQSHHNQIPPYNKRNPAPQPSQRRCGNGREEVRHPAGLVSRIPSLRKECGTDRQTRPASHSENAVAFGNIPNSALLFAHSVDHPLTKAVDTLFQSPVPCAYSTSALEMSSCHC